MNGHLQPKTPDRHATTASITYIIVQKDAGDTRLLLPKGPKTFKPCQMAFSTLEGMYKECFDALKA